MQTQEPKANGTFAKPPSQSYQELLDDLLGRMPFEDRWKPVIEELKWVIGGCKNPAEHHKLLPDYCYEILDVWRRTLFKNLPSLDDALFVTRNADGKSVKELRIDWRCLGRAISIGERGLQFFDTEAIPQLKTDGLLDLEPEKEKKALRMIFGDHWLKQRVFKLLVRPHPCLKKLVEKCRNLYFQVKIFGFSKWGRLAYRAGPKALAEFKAGVAEGQVGFLDGNGQLVGESNRARNYEFMLLVWPEIKEMLQRDPLPTRTEVFDWTKPYTKADLCSFIDIDQFRDFCEDIKLKFAGRTPKKA